MTRARGFIAALACGACLVLPGATAGQSISRAEVDAKVDEWVRSHWPLHLAKSAAEKRAQVIGATTVAGDDSLQESVYEAAIQAMAADPDLLKLIEPAIPEYVASFINERAESRAAVSTGGGNTSSLGQGLIEESGATSLAALAADLKSAVSADKTAVSVNLSALVFASLSDPRVYSDVTVYQRHDLLRRFSGTIVFGQQIPEKEITGLSGFPSADHLLDALSWDVKARIWGDKDVRSARWSSATVLALGLVAQQMALLPSLVQVPVTSDRDAILHSVEILRRVSERFLGKSLATTVERIGRSPQLSIKTSGTHLTNETGRNKLAVSALFDAGAGPSDFTVNAQYSTTDDVSLGPSNLFKVKSWTLGAALTSHLAPGAIVEGRTLDWVIGLSGTAFTDTASIPMPVKNTWKAYSTLDFPIKGGGKVPLSIIYSDDPNALTKQKHVSGHVGISYDFGALKNLFVPKDKP